jgi:hypothetical protein
MEESEKIKRTVDVLLDRPERFKVKWIWGIKLKFGIKPLRAGAIACIGKQAVKIKEPDKDNALSVLGLAATNVKPMSRIIAYAVLGSWLKIKLIAPILSRFLAWHLTPNELNTLEQLVIKQSNPQDFFSCTVLIKMIVPATLRTVQSKEEKPSGE